VDDLERLAKRCITHHRACDCREWLHLTELDRKDAELAALQQRMAEAERLLRQYVDYPAPRGGNIHSCEIEAFLAQTPSDSVMVPGDALRLLIARDEDELFVQARQTIKAALDREEKP
jgi:hypothetical protein